MLKKVLKFISNDQRTWSDIMLVVRPSLAWLGGAGFDASFLSMGHYWLEREGRPSLLFLLLGLVACYLLLFAIFLVSLWRIDVDCCRFFAGLVLGVLMRTFGLSSWAMGLNENSLPTLLGGCKAAYILPSPNPVWDAGLVYLCTNWYIITNSSS